ncbi:hypothetical protein NLI96_g4108 [Meripilus lineatus]|uniref:Uncharacterized protein n=1 Tax=Meripilus lineatus TaxID=2056292 RepID=A0AAD5YF33_9APHY|nr:hypothetical protein NLI96_g4108 [Physisporinus lineatus]
MSHWQADEVAHKAEGDYPEQRHAGAVGLGPEYGKGASTGDQLQGWKEEIVGKITHNDDKVQHGHDLRTGEINEGRRRKM